MDGNQQVCEVFVAEVRAFADGLTWSLMPDSVSQTEILVLCRVKCQRYHSACACIHTHSPFPPISKIPLIYRAFFKPALSSSVTAWLVLLAKLRSSETARTRTGSETSKQRHCLASYRERNLRHTLNLLRLCMAQ
jgi:hypothetical protein